MIQLRPKQLSLYHEAKEAIRNYDSLLIQAATGFGKTFLACFIIQQIIAKGNTVCFSVHRKALLRQTAKTFTKFGIPFGYIASGYPTNYYQPVQLASIDTLKNRLDKVPKFSVYIPDEAHFCAAAGWTKVLNHMLDQGSKVLGLSATPWRLSGEPMGNYFQHMIKGPPVRWLIDNKYLSDYRLICPSHANMNSVCTNSGEFSVSQTDDEMTKSCIYGDSIKSYKKYAYGLRAVAFCISINRCKTYAEELMSAGIMAVAIDGNTSDEDRRVAIKGFADGNILVLVTCLLVTEGFDLAAQVDMDVTVECMIDLSPTMSLSRHVQKMGRVLRMKEHRAVILDHANNVFRMINLYGVGFPDDEFPWTLEGRDKKRRAKDDEDTPISVRQCPECYAVHRPAPVCPECGHIYIIKDRKIEEIEAELAEVDPNEIRRQQRMDQGRARGVDDMVKLGYSKGRAEHILKARQEKLAMQTQLHNLAKGAQMARIPMEFTVRDISKMKPKMLRESISYLVEAMGG